MIQSVKKFESDNVLCSYTMTLSDGKVWSVPINEANTDYQNILEWEKIDGNVIEEAD